MKIYKNGVVIFNSIDNTGSTNDASLGARYALGRLDSTHNNLTQNYYTKDQVLQLIEDSLNSANLLKTMVVATVPSVTTASPNIIYLVPVSGQENVYQQYKKVLVRTDPEEYTMAMLGSTSVQMTDIQVTDLPSPTSTLANKVLQYVGADGALKKGRFYWCSPKSWYAWDYSYGGTTSDIGTYYTVNVAPAIGNYIYSGAWVSGAFVTTIRSTVITNSGEYITDYEGRTYQRASAGDLTAYNWIPLISKTSDFENDGDGTSRYVTATEVTTALAAKQNLITGAASTIASNDLTASKALMSDAFGKVAASNVSATELGYLAGVTSNIQDQIDSIGASGGISIVKFIPTLSGSGPNLNIASHNLFRITIGTYNFLVGQLNINLKNYTLNNGWTVLAAGKLNFDIGDVTMFVPANLSAVDKPIQGAITNEKYLGVLTPAQITTTPNTRLELTIPMLPLESWS